MLCDPPLLTPYDFKTWVTLKDLMDAHEALDLREASHEKANEP